MKNTTLCYIRHKGKYLLLFRNKKKSDPNEGKWIGLGGKFLENESPDECVKREVLEESGLEIKDLRLRAVVTFVSDEWEGEHMFLYTAGCESTETISCDEGELHWVDEKEMYEKNMWEGDRLFLNEILKDTPFFTMKLSYKGDALEESSIARYGGKLQGE